MELKDIRLRIDEINNEMASLFVERMDLAIEVAKYKNLNDIPVLDKQREEEILNNVALKTGEIYGEYAKTMFRTLFEVSRSYQQEYLSSHLAQYGLLGKNLCHSFSKIIHHALGSYDYRLISVAPNELEVFLKSRRFIGLNVTIPYKKTVIPFCDGLSPAAKAIGSVNTLTVTLDGSLLGDNTDHLGFLHMAKKAGISLNVNKALILGSGGTSLTVSYVLKTQGAKNIITVSRKGNVNYENIYEHSDADLIINTTPCGMFPNNYECKVDLKRFENLKGVLDVIYNPLKTKLILQAEELSIPSSGGLSMLVAQAKYSSDLFLNRNIDDSRIEKIENQLLKDLCNLVLIGMPSSGKTTIGKLLAQKLNREFCDIDTLIEEKANMTIPKIFEIKGEKAFRQIENEVIKEQAKNTGIIIATGGGAVLNPENVKALRQNGKVLLLKRDIKKLSTVGRPLSGNFQKLSKLEKERASIYETCCDVSFSNNNSIEDTVNKILEVFDENFGD